MGIASEGSRSGQPRNPYRRGESRPFICLLIVAAAIHGGTWLYNTLWPQPAATMAPPPPDGPQPGQIWQADVPFEDGTGSKRRPCVVLEFTGTRYMVLAITSKDKGGRYDTVRIPTSHWDPKARHDSNLKITPALPVDQADFVYHRGWLDSRSWEHVRRRWNL
jgi:hypothetical protein